MRAVLAGVREFAGEPVQPLDSSFRRAAMHTIYVIAGGLLLLGIFLLFARGLSGVHSSVRGRFPLTFIPVWLACAAFNMWVGVARAGYPLSDELPVFLVVFAVPAAVAFWFWRRARTGR
jgi:hypothetical protein